MSGKERQQPGKTRVPREEQSADKCMPNLGESVTPVLLEKARGQHMEDMLKSGP